MTSEFLPGANNSESLTLLPSGRGLEDVVLPDEAAQYAAILGNVLGRNFREVDPNCLLGGSAGLAHVLHYPVEHLALLLVGPSAPDIGSNPYLIRWCRLTGDVVTAWGNIIEDHLDQVAWRAGLLMMDRGDTADNFSFLVRRQPSCSSTANVGRHRILLSV